jgi:hypothetical protein
MTLAGRGARWGLGCLAGCLWRLLAVFLLGAVLVLAIYAVFAPWAFFLGGQFHPLAYWQGWGRLHSSAGGDYALFVRMWPSSGSRSGYPGVTGTAELCTPRGETYSLRMGGGFLNKHVGLHANGQPMHLYMNRRPWYANFVQAERRPRLDLYGAWHDPDLVMDDHGTLSAAFLPDGSLYVGPEGHQPARGEAASVTLRGGSHSAFVDACRALAR